MNYKNYDLLRITKMDGEIINKIFLDLTADKLRTTLQENGNITEDILDEVMERLLRGYNIDIVESYGNTYAEEFDIQSIVLEFCEIEDIIGECIL